MRLAELQRAVQDYVLGHEAPPPGLVAAVAEPAIERWEIYGDGYRLRLVEALGTGYPVLRTRLGAAAFAATANAFITATPSVHRSIRNYGAELDTFLHARAASTEDMMLAEVATFEWQLAAAFDAEDVVPTGITDLAGLAPDDWATLRFEGVPSLRRLRTTTNAVAVWRALRREDDAAAPASEPCSAPAAALSTSAAEWLISRRELTTEFRSLDPAEARALDRLLAGGTFGELCASLAEALGEHAALQAASWLKGWLLGGILLRRRAPSGAERQQVQV